MSIREQNGFDPDFPPESEINREATRKRELTWSPEDDCYVDDEGCLIFDRFGQPL
ncbi:MAG: hypothetical protein AAB691_03880 [Patescibacteria group bacterium]